MLVLRTFLFVSNVFVLYFLVMCVTETNDNLLLLRSFFNVANVFVLYLLVMCVAETSANS